MNFSELRHADPSAAPFALIRFSQSFYQEVAYRQEHERYCQWYKAMATQNQAEHRQLSRDINLFRWFRR